MKSLTLALVVMAVIFFLTGWILFLYTPTCGACAQRAKEDTA